MVDRAGVGVVPIPVYFFPQAGLDWLSALGL